MITDAEKYADRDRAKKERIEKLNRADRLVAVAERQLKEMSLNGYQITYERRKFVDKLIRELKDAIAKEDDYRLDRAQTELQEEIYSLSRELYDQDQFEEEDNFLGDIVDSIGNFANRSSRSSRDDDYGGSGGRSGGDSDRRSSNAKSRRPNARPNTSVSYDDDDDDEWI